ncbi:MAG: hypothetical protein F6K56_21905 [Moorea sp. SIO3G5]|nr:hypothetical protein [Moorena sp. SIO3G5]
MGETPKTALPPQDRAASPRPRCIANRRVGSAYQRGKLHYLSGALPTLHEPSLLRMVQDVGLMINN